jgi:hypothetical protein
MSLDRLSTWAPHALALLRIVAGLLFREHGTSKLLGFPSSPNPGPTFMTLMWFQGVIELIGGERWTRIFAQGVKWSCCLTAGKIQPANQERP